MKRFLGELLRTALRNLQQEAILPTSVSLEGQIERTRDPQHGDFASNVALTLAKQAGLKPKVLAEALIARLPSSEKLARVEVAGPGFINFFLTPTAFQAVVSEVLEAGQAFGRSQIGAGRRVQVEFVSANPTGPLHVGHGRGAAYGAAVADLLEAVGYRVHREYYVNDAGRQMNILATSIWLRYLELCGEALAFPLSAYQGDYVWDIAATLHREDEEVHRYPAARVFEDLPPDAPQGGDKERHIDGVIARAKGLLSESGYRRVYELGLEVILNDIRDDLAHFGVIYDEWFSERSLTRSGAVEQAIEQLNARGHLYKKDNALWFRSSDFGDEKDRVIVRENGQPTYFASDIAHHMDKLERGFARVIDVWGADHHGYVPRIKAALAAVGDDPSKLDVLLVQFAVLYRGGEKIPMSTRAGEFVTLRQLRREVGNDAARFFYVLRSSEQHLDFDLDLAKSRSTDNPVYYIQYAHARICSVMRQLEERRLVHDPALGRANLHCLSEPLEHQLLKALGRFPEVVELAALQHQPHQLAHFLRDLANVFHGYYDTHRVLVDDMSLRNARLNLLLAVRQVIANGLGLLGVSAPESM